MPIITEQMVNPNVGVEQVAQPNVAGPRALQQLGATASDIILDVQNKRTQVETDSAIAAFQVNLNAQVNEQLAKARSDSNANWTINGATIKDNIRKDFKGFAERAAEQAPNGKAQEAIRLEAQRMQSSVDNRLEVIHADRVLDENKKLYDEVGGTAIASLTMQDNAFQADAIYKQNFTVLAGMRNRPYSNPSALDVKDSEFVARFNERYAFYGEINNPLTTLATYSPEIASHIQNIKQRIGRDAEVNPFADLAFKGRDGQFYYNKYSPATQTFQTVRAEIDASLYPDAAYINMATKEVVVSQKQLMSSPRTPQFVKDLYAKNPDKASAILNNLITSSVKRKRDDATLQQQMIDKNSEKALRGDLTPSQAQQSKLLAADPLTMGEASTKKDKLTNFFKATTASVVSAASQRITDNPVMDAAQLDSLIKETEKQLDNEIESVDPLNNSMLNDLGDNDLEAGKQLARDNVSVYKDNVKKALIEIQESKLAEFQKDGAAYRRKLLNPEAQAVVSNFFNRGIYEKEMSPQNEAILTKSVDSYLSRLQLDGFHAGVVSVGMNKNEEESVANYLKNNTSNPEAVDNVINNLNKVIGPNLTAQFLDRNGLSTFRSFSLLNTNQPLRVQIAQAEQAMPKMLDSLKALGHDPKTIEEQLLSDVKNSELVQVLSVGGGVNKQMNAAAVVSNIKSLTIHNIVNGNLSPSEARRKAVKDYMNSFDVLSDGGYNGRYYLYSPKGGMKDKGEIKEWIDNRGTSVEYLSQKNLIIPETFRKDAKGLYSEKELREKWAKQISSTMKWVTNSDGTGMRLMYADKENNLVPVFVGATNGTKSPFEVSFKEVVAKQKAVRSPERSTFQDTELPANNVFNRYSSPLQKQIDNARFNKETSGIGLSPDIDVETSAAANFVDPQWINDTLIAEGETAKQRNFTFERIYVENKPTNFLHSMRISNFATLNSAKNQAIVGETPVFIHKENGKEYISYLPLPPKKYLELSKEDKAKYEFTLEEAAKKTLKNWTQVSTNPEVARFMQGKRLTQDQFQGIADIWHTLGATKLLGGGKGLDPSYKQLGDLLRDKKFDEALSLIAKSPVLFKELGANTFRFKRLERFFGGNRA